MDLARFRTLLSSAAPPDDMSPLVQALWWEAKGDWTKAHEVAQAHEDKDAAWVHAYLHRVEGDLSNARYWYRQAGRPAAQGSLEAEREAIVAALA